MDSRSEYSTNREVLSSVGKVFVDLKYMLFQINRSMLIDEESSILVTLTSLTIEMFQLLYISFNRNIYQAWKNNEIAEMVRRITGYLLVVPQFEYMNYSAMIISLYLFVGIIVFIIFLYLILSSKNDKVQKNILVTTLRLILNLVLSVLYMPIIDLLIAVFTCNDESNVHFAFQTVQCWNGPQLVHSIVAIIFLIIFYFMTILFSFIYFESRLNYASSMSKLSGFDDFVLKTFILAQILNYSFTNSEYIQIIILLLGNVALYVYCYASNSQNNLYVYKYKQIIISVNIWTAMMLAFAKVLEEVIFVGTIYAWLLGIPLLILIILQNPEERYELLMLDTNKANSYQLQLLNHHLLRLYSWGGQLYGLIVEGYMKMHLQRCTRQDCGKEIIKVIQQNYLEAIKRFPYDFQLKIRYGFFLLDILNYKQQALNEFTAALNLQPTIDSEFIIYRYRKVIEEEMNDQNYEMVESHNETLYSQMSKNFQTKIERVTLVQMDFWSQLQEDLPDLGRLNKIGLQIQGIMEEIDQLWKRILKFKFNTSKILRIYGKFMIDVMQDVEYGESLLDKIKQIDTSFVRKGISIASKDEISQEAAPTILVSLSQDKYGQISNLNLACHIFGYQKNELINRKISVLIPTIFQKQHDLLLRQGFDPKLQKERQIFIRNKLNYLMPCSIEMKTLQATDGSLMIIGQFKVPKAYKQQCFILFDNDDIIDSMTTNCIGLLGIELKFIQNKKLLISELFPQLLGDRNDFFNKEGQPLKYVLSEEFISGAQLGSQEQIEISNFNKVQEFQCYMQPKFLNQIQVGYLMRLDIKEMEKLVAPIKKAKCCFQFKYSVLKKIFLAEYTSDTSSAVLDMSSVQEQSIDQSGIMNSNQNQTQLNEQRQSSHTEDIVIRPKYDEGIKTLQLFQNRIQELEKEDAMEEIEEEGMQQQQSVFQNNIIMNNEDNGQGNINLFKSRQSLYTMLSNEERFNIISKLKWFSNIMFIFLICLGFTEFFFINSQFNDIEENIKLINVENQMHSRLQQALTDLQNLKYLSFGIWQIDNTTEQEAVWRQSLLSNINQMQDLNREFVLTSLTLTTNFYKLKTTDSISMQFDYDSYQVYDFMEATQQIISKGLEVVSLNLSDITTTQSSVYFLEYNLLNQYWLALRNISNELVISLNDRTLPNQGTEQVVISISSILLFVSLGFYSISLLLINQKSTQYLQQFLDIPEKTVKYFYGKCESFISSLQVGEEEDNLSLQDELEKEEQIELNKTLKMRKRKKKFISSNTTFKEQLLICLLFICIAEGYYIFTYFVTEDALKSLHQQVPEYNVTVRCDAYYRMCDNAERATFFNSSQEILGGNAYEAVKQNIISMYAFDTSMQQLHALNVDVQNIKYREVYDSIMMKDPCPELQTLGAGNSVTCQSFARGALAQGMSIGVARYIENLRYIMTIYDKFYGKGAANFTTISRGDAVAQNIVSDPEWNNILNLNNFNQTKESRIFQSTYLYPGFQYLVDNMISSFESDVEMFFTTKLAVFIIFVSIIFIIQFLIILPYLIRLNKQLTHTKLLLTMIPIRLITKIDSIKQFIRDIINLENIQY